MIYKQSQNWKLWGGEGVHPVNIGCVHDGRDQCSCKYHVVNKDRTEIYDFETWQEAEDKYCSLAGQGKFIPGKTSFDGTPIS